MTPWFWFASILVSTPVATAGLAAETCRRSGVPGEVPALPRRPLIVKYTDAEAREAIGSELESILQTLTWRRDEKEAKVFHEVLVWSDLGRWVAYHQEQADALFRYQQVRAKLDRGTGVYSQLSKEIAEHRCLARFYGQTLDRSHLQPNSGILRVERAVGDGLRLVLRIPPDYWDDAPFHQQDALSLRAVDISWADLEDSRAQTVLRGVLRLTADIDHAIGMPKIYVVEQTDVGRSTRKWCEDGRPMTISERSVLHVEAETPRYAFRPATGLMYTWKVDDEPLRQPPGPAVVLDQRSLATKAASGLTTLEVEVSNAVDPNPTTVSCALNIVPAKSLQSDTRPLQVVGGQRSPSTLSGRSMTRPARWQYSHPLPPVVLRVTPTDRAVHTKRYYRWTRTGDGPALHCGNQIREANCSERNGLTITTSDPQLVILTTVPGRFHFEVTEVVDAVPSEPVEVTALGVQHRANTSYGGELSFRFGTRSLPDFRPNSGHTRATMPHIGVGWSLYPGERTTLAFAPHVDLFTDEELDVMVPGFTVGQDFYVGELVGNIWDRPRFEESPIYSLSPSSPPDVDLYISANLGWLGPEAFGGMFDHADSMQGLPYVLVESGPYFRFGTWSTVAAFSFFFPLVKSFDNANTDREIPRVVGFELQYNYYSKAADPRGNNNRVTGADILRQQEYHFQETWFRCHRTERARANNDLPRREGMQWKRGNPYAVRCHHPTRGSRLGPRWNILKTKHRKAKTLHSEVSVQVHAQEEKHRPGGGATSTDIAGVLVHIQAAHSNWWLGEPTLGNSTPTKAERIAMQLDLQGQFSGAAVHESDPTNCDQQTPSVCWQMLGNNLTVWVPVDEWCDPRGAEGARYWAPDVLHHTVCDRRLDIWLVERWLANATDYRP